MRATGLLVYESTGRWAAALRYELPESIRIVETRSVDAMLETIGEGHVSLAALELTGDRAAVLLPALARVSRDYPQLVSIVLAEREVATLEFAAREAGAAHFIDTPRRLREAAGIAARVAARRMMDPEDDEPQQLEQRILASLPWAR